MKDLLTAQRENFSSVSSSSNRNSDSGHLWNCNTYRIAIQTESANRYYDNIVLASPWKFPSPEHILFLTDAHKLDEGDGEFVVIFAVFPALFLNVDYSEDEDYHHGDEREAEEEPH